MQDNKYNMNGLWRVFSQTGNETLSLSVYNGSASLVVFKKGSESKRPSVKMNLSLPALALLAKILRQLKDAQPGTRSPFVQRQFDKESREYTQATSFVFFKDEKRCYGVEISNKFISTPIKIYFKAGATFSKGSEPLSDEQRSILGMDELIYWVEVGLPEAALLSRLNMELAPRGMSGNGQSRPQGGNGYQRNGGSRDPYAASNPDTDGSAFE